MRLILFALQADALQTATSQAAKSPQWYEQVTGVIAIPAALIGLAYAYLLVQKTRLESHKMQLEIAEKEHAVSVSSIDPTRMVAVATDPSLSSLRDRRYFMLLVRFIVMELLFRLYNVLTSPIQWAVQAALIGMNALEFHGRASTLVVSGIAYGVSLVTSVGYWILLFAVGWPLFKDANHAMGIDLAEYRPSRIIQALRTARR